MANDPHELTVTEVSAALGVSTRMLRYYEKEGLITCGHREDYAYRVYDETAVKRLQTILLLRKLRIPLKDIRIILDAADEKESVRIFLEQIDELEEEIRSLRVVRDILRKLIMGHMNHLPQPLLSNGSLLQAVESLPLSKSNLKEKPPTMSELNKANETISKAENVRIVHLPPMTVAAYQYIGENPEETTGRVSTEFVRESGIYEVKPDARMYGFNHPSPSSMGPDFGVYGYEVWITVPEDFEVPAPLTKKHFEGGLYAVMAIQFPEFHRWMDLTRWAEENETYEPNYSPLGDEIMGGCLEDHLNWVYDAHMSRTDADGPRQIDLMLPIKPRETK